MVGDLEISVGCVLEEAATALHVAMGAVLRPEGLTVAQLFLTRAPRTRAGPVDVQMLAPLGVPIRTRLLGGLRARRDALTGGPGD